MATGQSNRLEDYLSCTICFEYFNEPKSLPCLHTFCLKCLEGHVRNNRQQGNVFACPICRENCKVPENGIQGFRTNFMIQGLKDVVNAPTEETKENETLMCDEHPLAEAKQFCKSCYRSVCTVCVKRYHNKPFCHLIESNPSSLLRTLSKQQKGESDSLQKDIETWAKETDIIYFLHDTYIMNKEELLEETNKYYDELIDKIQNEKESICKKIDEQFDFSVNVKDTYAMKETLDRDIAVTEKYLKEHMKQYPDTGPIPQKVKFMKDARERISEKRDHLQEMYKGVTKRVIYYPPQVKLRKLAEEPWKPFATLDIVIKANDFVCEWESLSGSRGEEQNTYQTANFETPSTRPQYVTAELLHEFSIRSVNDQLVAECQETKCIDNHIFVHDLQNKCIKIFNSEGDPMGKVKDKHDHFSPHGLCTLSNGTLAVSYRESNAIKYFDVSGNFKRIFRIDGTEPIMIELSGRRIALSFDEKYIYVYANHFKNEHPYEIECDSSPMYMCVNKEGNLFLSDTEQVYYYSFQTQHTRRLSASQSRFEPRGLCVDTRGNLLVASKRFSKIHIYYKDRDYEEEVLLEQQDGLHHPRDVSFNKDGNLVVGQANGKVKIFYYKTY